MDINEQLQPVVASLIEGLKGSLEQEIKDRISAEVINKIASTEIDTVVAKIVEQRLNDRVAEYDFGTKVRQQLDIAVGQLSTQFDKSLIAAANDQITRAINQKAEQLDIQKIISTVADAKLSALVDSGNFPINSIPHASVNFAGLKLSGDQIRGGIIEQFGSTGIEDLATGVKLTIMDQAAAFEGPLWAPSANIKGDLTVDGNLIVVGEISDTPALTKLVDATSNRVRENLTAELFDGFSNTIFKKIQVDGLDLDQITQGGKEIVKGNQLGYHITDTNIQRLGIVRDLQTQGENLLTNTLYVTNGRIGINTMDPSAVFSLWDEEVEINLAKYEQDVGYIGTPRYQKFILGSNSRENIILHVDGHVEIEKLVIGKTLMSSARELPNYNGELGQIVWNETPSHGGVVGWICLGATRWAKFGIID
jgi:hypothetical protein